MWLRPGLEPLAVVFVVSIAAKIGRLLLEEIPKLPREHELRKEASPESCSGTLDRSLFWWLNGLFLRGYRVLLSDTALSRIPAKFDSQTLLDKIEPCRQNAVRNRNSPSASRTFRAFAFQALCAVPPPLALSAFKFSQPFRIKHVIEFVEAPAATSTNSNDLDVARGLISAAVLIYVGIALSKCVYEHLVNQLITMIRGALVMLIFKKTLSLEAHALADEAPLTLMSTDIDGVKPGLTFVHDIWVAPLELGVGIYLLYREIGAPCFLVVIPIIGRPTPILPPGDLNTGNSGIRSLTTVSYW